MTSRPRSCEVPGIKYVLKQIIQIIYVVKTLNIFKLHLDITDSDLQQSAAQYV